MKVDRVIVCLNANETYTGFWNVVSKVWRLLFRVTPTLAFVGTQEEVEELGLSDTFGDIVVIPPALDGENNTFSWEVTWALFYVPTLFPDDVCMTCGIDQIPLGNDLFFDAVKEIPEDKFFVGFGNAYGHDEWYPSSHLVAKGKLFQELFGITSDFKSEVRKVEEWGLENRHIGWGLDEWYSGSILKNHPDVVFGDFFDMWRDMRIDRAFGLGYDVERLKNYEYSELHSPRPYAQHKEYIDKLVGELLEEVIEYPQEF